jgi:hypothetical protein
MQRVQTRIKAHLYLTVKVRAAVLIKAETMMEVTVTLHQKEDLGREWEENREGALQRLGITS